jgi:hypothetical protein
LLKKGLAESSPIHTKGRKVYMNYKVNFQKAKRNYMVLTFEVEEGKEKTILVGMPKKRIFDMLMSMNDFIKGEEPDNEKEKAERNRKIIDEMYELVAMILSNNMAGEKISVEWVEDMLEFGELKELLETYVKFCKGEAVNPN